MTLLPCASRARAFTRTSKADSTAILDILSASCIRLARLLNQSAGAAGPARALVFRDGLHVLHVGAGLRKDVVQVVAEADEGEPFLQELAHARGAEQEQAQDHAVLLGRSAQL